tara:strand:- start:584 stop:1258 length:675 start_codon:yes stop_codon:yes gene_type:complete
MTGLELMALASAIQAGGKMVKGGFDWLNAGSKISGAEAERMRKLRERINAKVISDQDVARAEQFGTRRATSTMNQAVEAGRGALAQQGLGNSIISSQVGLKEAQNLADAQSTQAIQTRQSQAQINKEASQRAEDQLSAMRQQLAERRKAQRQQGASDFISGGMDLITLGAQQKMAGGFTKSDPIDPITIMKPKKDGFKIPDYIAPEIKLPKSINDLESDTPSFG